jgi:hypothetical protein
MTHRSEGPFSPERLSLEEAYPDVETMELTVTRSAAAGSSIFEPSPRKFTEKTVGEYIPCLNPACSKEGFRFGRVLADMYRTRQTRREWLAPCEGKERIGKTTRPCNESWDVVAEVTYLEAAATT